MHIYKLIQGYMEARNLLNLGGESTTTAEDNVDTTKCLGNDTSTKTRVREKLMRGETLNKGNRCIWKHAAMPPPQGDV